jgi:ribose-phosphate pyrophosphokinase
LDNKNIKLFSGNSNRNFALSIANELGILLGDLETSKFSDGEVKVEINETVRGFDVFVVQSFSSPTNDNLIEFLIILDALKRASAGRITAVIPYYGYSRQDKKIKAREPISAKLVANLLVTSGANRILTMDLHADQIQGFFDIPVDHLFGMPPVLVPYYNEKFVNKSEVVVVSPDLGSVKRSRDCAEKLDVSFAVIDKRRTKANVSEVMNIIGDVNGKIVILMDDLIDTAGTIVNSAVAAIENGAKKVFACCTHGVLSGNAIEKIENSPIEELAILDTIEFDSKLTNRIKLLSAAYVFSEAIRRIHENVFVSEIFT